MTVCGRELMTWSARRSSGRLITAPPEIVAEQHDRFATLSIVLGIERPANLRGDAEHREQLVADRGAGIAIGIALIAHRETAALHPRDRAERVRALLPVPQIEPGQAAAADAAALLRGVELT